MYKIAIYVFSFFLISNVAFAEVATGTTDNWPNYSNRAEACANAKNQAKVAVNNSTQYYGKVTGFGQCDCSSETDDEGNNKYICTVDAYYTNRR